MRWAWGSTLSRRAPCPTSRLELMPACTGLHTDAVPWRERGAGASPTTVTGTTALGEETIDLTLIVSTTGVSATDGIGTLAIVPECVVSLTGVSATGGTGEELIYSLIVPNQTANWQEVA